MMIFPSSRSHVIFKGDPQFPQNVRVTFNQSSPVEVFRKAERDTYPVCQLRQEKHKSWECQ
jgi:hypothetical protein